MASGERASAAYVRELLLGPRVDRGTPRPGRGARVGFSARARQESSSTKRRGEGATR